MDAPRSKSSADTVVGSETDADSFDPLLKQIAQVSPSLGASGSLAIGTGLLGGRLTIQRRIGQGGMGVVYEAFDAQRGDIVALKTLTHAGADGVYRLKTEFRALAETRHPNLVSLHELCCDGAIWCFTMELVQGQPFDLWVRPDDQQQVGSTRLDLGRLRQALPQLFDAVAAIHDAGKLHRDLKPSNVLVTDEGRVVVLDFGLAVDPEPGGVGQTVPEPGVTGTPAYMAPEQAAGSNAVQASDLYAVGTMLFEALTGQLPFQGTIGAILAAKQYDAAPLASTLTPDAPSDLVELCARLLARDPAARPSARSLLPSSAAASLDRHSSVRLRRPSNPPSESAEPKLFGRAPELSLLSESFDITRSGNAVVLFVSGESGIGKTSLCEAFLREARATRGAIVLAGRCNERENIPFKGFDSLVDDLSRHLRRLARAEVEPLLPRDAALLPRLFPVLDRIPAIAEAPRRLIAEPQEIRRCAFNAFAELIARMRDRAPLCVHLDDAQWLDTDSVLLIRALLLQPDPPPWLWLISHRSEDADQNPALLRVRDAVESNRKLQQRTLALGPLSESAAQQLAAMLLPPSVPHDVTNLVARESGGSPLFVDELVRYLSRHFTNVDEGDRISLATALADHVAGLSSDQRRVLEHVALAGRPVRTDLVIQASGGSHDALDVLRSVHLVRSSSIEGSALVECYHDKVRETVCAKISDSQRIERSTAMAAVLDRHTDVDPELLARCFEGAGQRAQAARSMVRAADSAMRGMAFMHAAGLYAHALSLHAWGGEELRALRIAHGSALAHAGRGKQAAEAYLLAADGCSATERLELRRCAAEQLQTTGHVDEGTALFRELFRELGLTLPVGTTAALRHLVVSKLRLRIRGMAFTRRHPRDISAIDQLRLETMRAALDGIAAHAPLIAASITDDYVRLALDAGVPKYLADGLASQAYFTSFSNPGAAKRIDTLIGLAASVADDSADAELVGRVNMIRGAVAHNRGRWTEGREYEARAIAELQRAGGGITWALDGARTYAQLGAFFAGDFRDIAENTRALVEEGLNLDRVWIAAMLSGPLGSPAWLSAGDDDGFERILGVVRSRWQPQAEPLWPDFNAALGQVALQMYRGESGAAHAACERAWPAIARSLVVRAEIGLAVGAYFRGTTAVAALRSADGVDARGAQAAARDSGKRLGRLRLTAARPLRAIVQAGIALHARNVTEARELLSSALVGFDENGMAMFVAATRRRLGELLGGSHGAELITSADVAMRTQGVANPDAMTDLLCGGCRSR